MDSITLAICQVDPAKAPECKMSLLEGDMSSVAVVTWIPEDDIFRIGLPRGSICGVLRDPTAKLSPDNFVQNRDFLDIVHYLNVNHLDPGLIEFLETSHEPNVAVIDQRTSDVNGAVPAEDIIGMYEVEGQQVTKYRPNPNYRLITNRGSFMLTPWLRKCLVDSVLPKEKWKAAEPGATDNPDDAQRI